MGKSKQIKAEEIVSVPKQKPAIMPKYKPMPRFHSGCKNC